MKICHTDISDLLKLIICKINYISIPLQKIDHFTDKMCCRSVSELVQGSSQEENWKSEKEGT